jgi:hypothetical protein
VNRNQPQQIPWKAGLVLGGALLVGLAVEASAQAQPTRRRPAGPARTARSRAVELSFNFGYVRGYDLGSHTATLTPNIGGSPLTLFTASSEMRSAAAFEGRVGYQLTRIVSVEGGVTFSQPKMRLSLSSDLEVPNPGSFDGEKVSQYVVDVSAVGHLLPLAFYHQRIVPFVLGGGGYLRQAHEDRALVDTGQSYHVGGGIKYFTPKGPRGLYQAGLRAEARYYWQEGGFDFDSDRRREFATALLGLTFRF